MPGLTFERPTRCPSCGVNNEAASAPDGGRCPIDGDASICLICGEWGLFDSSHPGGMRQPTAQEYAELAAEPEFRRLTQARHRMAKEWHRMAKKELRK